MSHQINRTFKKLVGSNLVTFAECSCSQCSTKVERPQYTLKIWSGLCRRCANLIKLAKARTVPNPADGRPYEALYNNLVKHTKAKNKRLDLSFEEFTEFTSIKECHYCKSEVTWTIRNLTKNGYKYNLDRIDNDKGYSKENCVVCCWRCNNGRSNLFSYEEWYGMTEYLRKQK